MAKNLTTFREDHSEKVESLKSQIREQEARIKEYRSEHGKLELFFEQVLAAVEPVTPLPVEAKPIERKGTSNVVPLIQGNDWHIGEVQDPNEIEGFNAFNYSIAQRRIQDGTRRFIDWANLHRNVYNINSCQVIYNGDLISGDIHEELKVTNEWPTPVQVVKAAQQIAVQVGMIATQFEFVRVDFISEDNHARLTKKPQAKEAGKNSFNYLVGVLAQAYLEKHENVSFEVHQVLEAVINVNGMRYLVSHGHSVRGWMGVPWYGIERKVGKESQARMQLIMDDKERAEFIGFDKYLIGHFHTPFDSALYCCGPSLSGTSAYDHQAGRYADPGIAAWMVHEKHKEFNRIVFNLKDIK